MRAETCLNNHQLMRLCVFRLWSPVGEETHRNKAGHERRRTLRLGAKFC